MIDRDSDDYADFRMQQAGCSTCGSEDGHKLWCVWYGEEDEDDLPVDLDDEETDDDTEHRMPWSDDDVPDGGGP